MTQLNKEAIIDPTTKPRVSHKKAKKSNIQSLIHKMIIKTN